MIIDSNTFVNESSVEGEICIVGGGVAGIVLALELSYMGVNVIILESGDENYSQDAQSLYEPVTKPTNYPDPTYSRLRFLGGSSNHWENNTSPLDPIDFERREWVPNSGWPISIDDIAPFYRKAADYCGCKTDGYEADFWFRKFGAKNIVGDSSYLVPGIAKASRPPVRMFHKFEDELKKSKHVRIYKNANFIDIGYDKLGQRLDRVYFKSTSGDDFRHQAKAKEYIFCMGGIENARMLLHVNQKHENSLGNQNDNVGRYFMDHPLARAATFYPTRLELPRIFNGINFDDRFLVSYLKLNRAKQLEHQVRNLRMPLVKQSNYILSDGISSSHIVGDALSDLDIPDNFGIHLSNMFSDSGMILEAITRKVFDTKLFDHADEFGGFQIPAMLEQAPYRSNRVLLSDVKDRFEIPKIQIHFELKQEDKDQMWKALELTARAMGALSIGRIRLLKEREDRLWGDQLSYGHHHMGTTRMSTSSKLGVVDINSKVHGTKNLYVGGSSVFCTGGHVPPTLTIVALSLRLAKHIVRKISND